MLDLQRLASRIHNCFDCDLSQSRTKAVPGEGPKDADLMLIGEGPGFNEDQQSRPFVGAAGQYLDELLSTINMNRESVFITNMVKCRPPNNRDPLPGEIEACNKYVDEQIQIVQPKVIVTLGRHSLGKFLPGETIGKVHGKPTQIGDLIVYPIYHPAAALRRHSLRLVIESDFQLIPSLLKGDIEKEQTDDHKSQQLSVFE
jgi:DNA polymerase